MSDSKELSTVKSTEGKLCSTEGKLCSTEGKLCSTEGKLCSTEGKLCSSHELFQHLENTCEKYSTNPDYVFKSCIFDENLYLIILKKRPETKTNELRKNVNDPKFAPFRADVLDVIAIINTFDPQRNSEDMIVNKCTYTDTETIYNVGQTVRSDKYDTNIDIIYSSGIHYFKSIEPAFMFHINTFAKRFNSLRSKIWYNNGTLCCDKMYENGKLSGLSKEWYDNGQALDNPCNQIYIEGKYEHGKEIGLWTEWYENGTINTKTNYANGRKSGLYQKWYKNGVLWQEGNYVNGEPSGIWMLWGNNGVLNIKTNCASNDQLYKNMDFLY